MKLAKRYSKGCTHNAYKIISKIVHSMTFYETAGGQNAAAERAWVHSAGERAKAHAMESERTAAAGSATASGCGRGVGAVGGESAGTAGEASWPSG